MIFNSIDFAVFLPLVFALYWLIPRHKFKMQNGLLLLASYVFYGWWDWRFLSLIVFSSVIDFLVGRQMHQANSQAKRKQLLWLSIGVNLGFLGFFKYFNFFADSFAEAFTLLGTNFDPLHLNIVLPVGISFYTFQTLSYSIDVYKGKMQAEKDVLSFFTYVSFFPQLVAGPIERSTNLLPQFNRPRTFNPAQATDGMRQILFGLFKKMVIADNCAIYVNEVFANYSTASGSTLLLAAVFFAFQIYGDFSGYSDIAIGTSRLFGFSLMQNFAFPYFSRDIAEFWRRWHISLSTWFRDYLYIPLGGSKGNTAFKVRNTFIIFIVSGFWHGANWTFIIWGALNALYFLPLLLAKRNRKNLDVIAENKHLPSVKEAGQLLITFTLTVLAWIFFRAPTVSVAFEILGKIFSDELLAPPNFTNYKLLLPLLLLLITEWLQRKQQHGLDLTDQPLKPVFRFGIYMFFIMIILLFPPSQQQAFIYFQF